MQLCWKNVLKFYLTSATDGLKKREAWSLLKSCVTGLLRKLTTRYKHQRLSMIFPVMEMHEERAQPSLISGPQKRDVIAPVKCATKNTQFGNVMCSRERNIERSGRRQRNLDSVTVAWRKGTLVINVLGAERVELTDARTDTTGYFMRSKWLLSPWRGRLFSTYERVHEHAKRSIASRTVP